MFEVLFKLVIIAYHRYIKNKVKDKDKDKDEAEDKDKDIVTYHLLELLHV